MADKLEKCDDCQSTKLHSRGPVSRLGKTYRRYVCKDCGTNHYVLPEKSRTTKEPPEKFSLSNVQVQDIERNYSRYVITSIQNDTPTNENFKRSLLNYVERNNAKLLIIPVRYKNPDSFHSGLSDSYTWDESLREYFVENEINLTSKIKILGDYYVGATNNTPISGLEGLARGKSIIVGHGILQSKSCPRLDDEDAVIVSSTGSLSVKNYSQSRAGYFANNSHTNAAMIVETDNQNNVFYPRHVIADATGSFYDIVGGFYQPDGWSPLDRIEALVLGDSHAIHASDKVLTATFIDEHSMVKALRPKNIVHHDLFDGYSQSHHDRDKFFTMVKKHVNGKLDLEAELKITMAHLVRTTYHCPSDVNNVIIPSNHNSHLMKWMQDVRSSADVQNAKIYTELRTLMMNRLDESGRLDEPFDLWLWTHMAKNYPEISKTLQFAKRTKSYKIAGVEVSQHGDIGADGARGSRKAFSKMGCPVIIGHSHSPGIEGQCYQVGTSSVLRMDYNNSISSWLHCHAIIYPNGQVQLINIVRGRWRLED